MSFLVGDLDDCRASNSSVIIDNFTTVLSMHMSAIEFSESSSLGSWTYRKDYIALATDALRDCSAESTINNSDVTENRAKHSNERSPKRPVGLLDIGLEHDLSAFLDCASRVQRQCRECLDGQRGVGAWAASDEPCSQGVHFVEGKRGL